MITEPSMFYEQIANKYGITVEQAREIIIYFWRNGVKRGIESEITDEVYINRLGSFKIKDYKLKYAIPDAKRTATHEGLHEKTVEYLNQLVYNLEQIDNLIKEKEKKYNEFIEQNSRDIQKSPSNMGGASEQVN